jgi:hypothetical protein
LALIGYPAFRYASAARKQHAQQSQSITLPPLTIPATTNNHVQHYCSRLSIIEIVTNQIPQASEPAHSRVQAPLTGRRPLLPDRA